MQIDSKDFKILYVDDEEGNTRIFQMAFKRSFNISTALSGEEALGMLENESFHMVLSDQKMPGMSGTALLTTVAQKYPDTIRAILTGFSDINAIIDAVNHAGIFKYISKPWDKANLKALLEGCKEEYEKRHSSQTVIEELQQQLREKDAIIASLEEN